MRRSDLRYCVHAVTKICWIGRSELSLLWVHAIGNSDLTAASFAVKTAHYKSFANIQLDLVSVAQLENMRKLIPFTDALHELSLPEIPEQITTNLALEFVEWPNKLPS